MSKRTYEYVKNYIEESGDQIISEEYMDGREKLKIKCFYCDEIFDCSFSRYQQGRRHVECKNKHLRSKEYEELRKPRSDRKIVATKEVTCQACSKIFKQKYSKQKVCNIECSKILIQLKKGTGVYEAMGRKGGIASAKLQVRRSFNEVYFSKLCEKVFVSVLTNATIFDGWDCDVVIEDLKIAVSWNGVWHYKKVRTEHKLEQVQSRDKIKDSIIKKYGYFHYIIQDMGSKSKNFVIDEFNKFIEFVNREYNYNIKLDNYDVDMTEALSNRKIVKKKNIKEKNKCVECNKEISRDAKRCPPCYRINSRKVERPSLETLLENVKELGYAGTGRKYSVTDNTVRKWINNYQKEQE